MKIRHRKQYDGFQHFSPNVCFIAESSILTAGTQTGICALRYRAYYKVKDAKSEGYFVLWELHEVAFATVLDKNILSS